MCMQNSHQHENFKDSVAQHWVYKTLKIKEKNGEDWVSDFRSENGRLTGSLGRTKHTGQENS